jgi:hypothetical protein
MTAVGSGSAIHYDGQLGIETVTLYLPQPTGYTYTSKLSEVFGCQITASAATAGTTILLGGLAGQYYTLSGNTITFTLPSISAAETSVFVTIYGRL